MIDAASSLGVRVHVAEKFEPAFLPESLRKDKRVIVVAFDESCESQNSLDWALKNVFDPKSDILILISVAIFQEPFWFMESEEEKNLHKTSFADAYSSKLSTVASSILDEYSFEHTVKVHHDIFVLSYGDARSAIVEYCSILQADLLVMGNRGIGLLTK